MHEKRVALVTGANKGIGLETARQLARKGLTVLLGSRDAARGDAAARRLQVEGLDARPLGLDVIDAASIVAAAHWVEAELERLDVLVNNAGVALGRAPPSGTDLETMRMVFEVNVFGAVAVTRAMLPLLLRSAPDARIVNVSSGVGSLTNASNPAWEFAALNSIPYPASKAALNMITVHFAKELRGTGIKVNAADPGFTATDLNQHRGTQSVEEGARASVALATLDATGPTGGFFSANGPVPW
jgi:NAD(P)-dependent dehydrogenase (short-subunit alcohol dehydrogenase family)